MRILSITLKNIKAHRDYELRFVSGINVLSGPNGAGKSTIFEAVGYGLFGVDARDFVTNINRFLTIGTKRGEISVTFVTDDEKTFRVSRGVGPGSKWLLAREHNSVFEVEEHAGTSETEARLKKLLGLDNGRSLAEQFKLVIGPFQNDFLGPFIIRQPTRRREAFDEILGIDAWRRTYRGTSGLQKLVSAKIEVLDAAIAEKKEQVADLPEHRRDLKEILARRKKLQKQLTEKKKQLTEVTTRVRDLEQKKKKLDSCNNELKGLKESIRSGTEYIAAQKLLVRQSEEAAALVEQSRSGKEAYDRADAELAVLREQERKRRALEQEKARLEKEQIRLADSLKHEQQEIKQADLDLDEEEKKLARARRELKPDRELLRLADQLDQAKKDLEALQKSRGLLEGRKQNLLEGRAKLAQGNCPFFREPCRNLDEREPGDVFSTRLADLDREMAELDREMAAARKQLAACEQAGKKISLLEERKRGLDEQAEVLARRWRKNSSRAKQLVKLQEDIVRADKALQDKTREMAPFARLDDAIKKAQQEKQKHLKDRDLFTKNLQGAADLDSRRRTLEKYQQRLREHEKKKTRLISDLTRLEQEYLPEQHDQARTRKEELLSEIAQLTEQVENLGRDRQRLEAEIKKLEQVNRDIKEKQAERERLVRDEKLVRFLRNRVFKLVSGQLSERFREEISLRADRIYRTISETDEELSWGEGYSIVLRDMRDGKIRERSDDQLSGGQIMSAVVALRLALLQTIGARIAFFDEPTSNLDAARRENLARAFRAIDVGREEVTEHWYDQLFLISHDVAFTEITDQIITLE